jgi:hypothetical protein
MVPLSLLGAVILTALLTASILAGRWQASEEPSGRRQLAAWPGGVALAFLVGAVVYSGHPRWPFTTENEDRFLGILLPLMALVEIGAIFLKPWLAWFGRLLVAGSAVPLLLWGSAYFQTWSTTLECLWLTGLPIFLMLAWVSLDLQIQHLPPRTVLFGLAGVNAGAGVVLLIAGYATGGPLGIILGMALATTVLVTPRTLPTRAVSGAASIGLVGLFALLVSGHFFAELALAHAAILFAAPFLAWVLVLPRIRKTVLLRTAVLALEALPVLGAAGLAWQHAEEPREAPRPANNAADYSPADYEQFGK